jgi:hypothetical protein
VTVAGVPLPANSPVRLLWGAANLDERQFADPEKVGVKSVWSWGFDSMPVSIP